MHVVRAHLVNGPSALAALAHSGLSSSGGEKLSLPQQLLVSLHVAQAHRVLQDLAHTT